MYLKISKKDYLMLYANDQLNEEYKSHRVFSRLDEYIKFYNRLSD